jgi:aspartyl/asparaginyl-tRNA synthetase
MCLVGDVYTFGPTFTGREFANLASLADSTCWNQMAFADLDSVQNNAEQMLKFVVARSENNGRFEILSRDF